MSATESLTSKAITIRSDEQTLSRLDELARASDRSRNYLANLALKQFIARQEGVSGRVKVEAPIAERLADYRSAYWQADEEGAFLEYLAEERRRSLQRDRLTDLE